MNPLVPLALLLLPSPTDPALTPRSADAAPARPAAPGWGDWNADGRPDLLVLGGDGAPRLLVQATGGELFDVTALAGLQGLAGVREASWQDFDGDGREDLLLVVPAGTSLLLRNDRSGTFAATTGSGLALDQPLRTASWLDYDLDGLPDLVTDGLAGGTLWHNLGSGRFEEVASGLALADQRPPTAADAAFVGTEAASAGNGVGVGGVGPSGSRSAAAASGICAGSLFDTSGLNGCLEASSVPTLGELYPLSADLNVDLSGNVGIGTTTPGTRLDVAGDVRSSGRLISTAGSGAPLSVASSTLVPSLNADLLDGLHASAFSQLGATIGTAELEDQAVTTAKIADDAITSAKYAPNSVDFAALANDAVSSAAIAPDTIQAVDIATGAVGSAEIANGAVTAADLAVGSVNSSHIGPGAVGNSDLAANAVSTDKILNGTIVGLDIANDSITASDIAPGAVTTSEILDGTIGAADIGTLTAAGSSLGVIAVNATGTTGTALVGNSTSTSGVTMGLRGTSASTSGRGVQGDATSTTGTSYGLFGTSNSTSGRGVYGAALANSGPAYGVYGRTNSSAGAGVYGLVDATTGPGYGILGETRGNGSGAAIQAMSLFSMNTSDGLRAGTDASSGYAVWGFGNAAGARGVVGSAFSGSAAVQASGDLVVTGAKNFAQAHPHDPSKEIRFACLEGNESGTYFRASATLVGGRAEIEVPEEFRLVSAAQGLTVQLTAYGPARLWIESRDLDRVVVRGDLDVAFDVHVHGLRRGFQDLQVLRENESFRPRFRGVPFGMDLPAELRSVLVGNGILNADFTPNEATAAALGWELSDPTASERAFLLGGAAVAPAAAKPR